MLVVLGEIRDAMKPEYGLQVEALKSGYGNVANRLDSIEMVFRQLEYGRQRDNDSMRHAIARLELRVSAFEKAEKMRLSPPPSITPEQEGVLRSTIEQFVEASEPTVRTANALTNWSLRKGGRLVRDLATMTKPQAIRSINNFGRVCAKETGELLAEVGLSFGMVLE